MYELKEAELLAVFGGVRSVDTSILPRAQTAPTQHAKLTPRQSQCLAWVAAGKTSAEIGAILGLSSYTVEAYLKAARRIYGVASSRQAASAAATDCAETALPADTVPTK